MLQIVFEEAVIESRREKEKKEKKYRSYTKKRTEEIMGG